MMYGCSTYGSSPYGGSIQYFICIIFIDLDGNLFIGLKNNNLIKL